MKNLGPLQLRVMHHLWKHGTCTVRDVHEAFSADTREKRLAYTTVLTVMRNLVKRRFLRQDTAGKAHQFVPLVGLKKYQMEMLRNIRGELFDNNHTRLIECLTEIAGVDGVARVGGGEADPCRVRDSRLASSASRLDLSI